MAELFRPEVIDYRRQRLYGDVLVQTSGVNAWAVVAISALVAGLLGWAATARYSRTEQVLGMVVSTKPAAKVVAQRPGLLKHLHAVEGEQVEKGDLLAIVLVDVSIAEGKYSGALATAEIEVQQSLLTVDAKTDERAYLDERQRVQDQIKQTHTETQSLDEQIAAQTQTVASATRIFELFERVVTEGIVSKNDYEMRRRDMLLARQRMSQLRQEVLKLGGQRTQLEAQLLKIASDRERQNSERAVRGSNLAQQRVKAQSEQEYRIVAPISGTVASLQTAEGRWVDGKFPLMTIIPLNARFGIELYAPTRSIGFLRAGQSVNVMYDAFPYQRFGSFRANVREVSRSIAAPSEVDTPLKLEEPIFRVAADLEQQQLDTPSGSFPLQHGMTLKANLVLEQRSLLDWMLSPINAVTRRDA